MNDKNYNNNVETLQIMQLSKINNLNLNINQFIKKLHDINTHFDFIQFIELSNKLTDSLIDICIKNKIDYFINNNISFSSIKTNFKLELENFLLSICKITFPFIEINITNLHSNNFKNTPQVWNDIIDILSIKKNKVSFNPTTTEYIYENNKTNTKTKTRQKKAVKIMLFNSEYDIANEISTEQKIAIYFKIILNDINNDEKLFSKLFSMCSYLYNSNIEYDIYNPYKNF
jgi:hypothetical protein